MLFEVGRVGSLRYVGGPYVCAGQMYEMNRESSQV